MGMAKEEAKKIIDRYLIKPHGMISCIIYTSKKK